jgi:hypothetical protein
MPPTSLPMPPHTVRCGCKKNSKKMLLCKFVTTPHTGYCYCFCLCCCYACTPPAAFNISDLLGKNIPFCGLAPSPRSLLACSLLRVVFVPAFLFAGRHAGGVVSLMALLTVSLGFSNG